MRTVRDDEGTEYLLLERSGESSLVRDPATGRRRSLPTDDLEPTDASPLEVAAEGVPGGVRRVLRVAHDDAALGLLLELDARGPTPVRDLLAAYDLCESDLHGLLAEFRVGGVVDETTVAGERAYRVTDEASDALARLRE
ncbi:MAG: hypothetical protein ABEJ04_03800 [Halobacteriaceae archaeon]